jgi:hypothetical protein
MRRMAMLVFLCGMQAALAQPKLEPVPPPPAEPAAPNAPSNSPDEPAVRIPVQKTDKVEEIREGGRVVMVKVTPANGGHPYYLVDVSGNGNWMRRDSLDDGLAVPMWPIRTFE